MFKFLLNVQPQPKRFPSSIPHAPAAISPTSTPVRGVALVGRGVMCSISCIL